MIFDFIRMAIEWAFYIAFFGFGILFCIEVQINAWREMRGDFDVKKGK